MVSEQDPFDHVSPTYSTQFLVSFSKLAEANESIPLATLPPIFSQLPPISVKLSDENFLMWQQQVDVAVYGHGLGYLKGDTDLLEKLIPDLGGESCRIV